MRRATAPSAYLPSPDYYKRLDHLQQGLRDSEKKRLELERKLYECNQSDICRVKPKYGELKKYLKEICESEKRARTRNQEYLKRFEQIQAHLGHFTAKAELKLQELKVEYETQLKKMQLLSKEEKSEVKEEDGAKLVMPAKINLGTAVSRGLYQPATIFMGRQMSAVSSMGDFSAEQKSPQPTKNFSIPDPHSHRQTAQRSDVTDSDVVQTNGDKQCLNKSDKTDGKTSLQIGEKMPVTASALSEEEQTHCSKIGSGACLGKSHLSEGRRSPGLYSPLQARLSPKNRTTDLKCDGSSRLEGTEAEILTRKHIEVEEERARPLVPLLSASESCASENKCSQEKHDAQEAFSDHPLYGDPGSQQPFRKLQEEQEEHSGSSSDLTVSISEDDLILETPEPQSNPADTMEGEDGIEALNLIHSEQERDALSTKKQNCIVQTVSSLDSKKESSTNLPARELSDHRDIVKEDLEACGAAVLHQPPRLSLGGGSHEAPGRVEQASGLVRTQSGQHVATLKGHDNSSQEEVAKLSEVFPVKNMDQRMRVAAALWKDLPEEDVERSAVGSRKSSCSSPSTLNASSGVKDAEPALWLSGGPTRKEEVSNDCREESAEESEEARMPITETKAYQMLKQSTLQDSARQHEAKSQKVAAPASQLLGLNVGSGTFKTKTAPQIASEASFSSGEGSPLSRHENKKNLTTNLKSKAFWGESDDSNSDIEAALRPRNHNTSTDDFDDFYDL
ncbi:centrosomal protein kizuna isoform X2 [Phacochoerus africanus]|uniref:centrosomal protein kizuna isoform X2 n=1 Tax=Phacochoerus africanus TaxID=41426 RepID=UPI001FDA98B1|nr:centrosomal protein kizuna isoform X2 [Phacochoerus africanus]